jgi:hypothetical protein
VFDNRNITRYHPKKSAVGELKLENSWFFPFKQDASESTDFVFNMFRTFENFDIVTDKL